MTKILLVVLNKSHMTLLTNNNELWMKEKINEIHLHPLIGQIRISFGGQLKQMMCCHLSHILII